MIKKLFIILLMGVTTILFAQTIAPKKCNTCGKPLAQCQYKGRHPKQSPKPKSGYENGYEWIDLGVSVKWATKNVGASSPSDYGGYYAWGEIRTKSRYNWDNCFDCQDGLGDRWSTYKVGGQTRITPTGGHDTARETWGGKWRMPTDAECNELCKKCTWTWTTMNGHKGYRVIGKNGNSIFLPAAGNYVGTMSINVGECGYYRSSTLSSSYSNSSRDLYFNKSGHNTDRHDRCFGRSIRPVIE